MKKKVLIPIIILFVIAVGSLSFYFYSLTPVSKDDTVVKFTANGTVKSIISDLYDAKLIRNKFTSYIYVRLNKGIVPKAGTYEISRNKSTEEIFRILNQGAKRNDIVSVIFPEGKNIRDYAKIVSEKFDISEEEFINTVNDKEFIKDLMKHYDFLKDDVLNSDIYYALEGYLYPAKYEFFSDASSKEIITKLLDKTKDVLDNIDMSSSKYSIHEILTIASIIENETKFQEDRPLVSQVIYKRLSMNMALGMDVTTYYAVKKSFKETLTRSDLDSLNAYNTRNASFTGLPVGPISNPRKESIVAALNPANTDYIYFYADVYGKDGKEYVGKLHFAKNYSEFQALIRKYS